MTCTELAEQTEVLPIDTGRVPRSLALVKSTGIKNGEEFINLMRCLILDVLEDRIDGEKAQLVCNIAGKLLRAVEVQCQQG